MVQQETDSYIKACMKTWMFCEACIHAEKELEEPRIELIEKCRNCASSCFGMVCRIINDSDLLGETALDCLLDCRECSAECEKYEEVEDIQYCGEVCRICAIALRELLLVINLN